MWTTTIVYNIENQDLGAMMQIQTKLDEFKNLDGAGLAIPGHSFQEQVANPETNIITVKRRWNQQQYAQQWVDWVSQFNWVQVSLAQDPV